MKDVHGRVQKGGRLWRRSHRPWTSAGTSSSRTPPIARYLFSNTQVAWIWLIARVWLGFAWIEAASHKVTDPAWAGGNGEALKAFWERALATAPTGKPVIAVDWYRDFIQALYNAEAWTWMAPIIAWSE